MTEPLCEICGEGFSSKSSLATHMKRKKPCKPVAARVQTQQAIPQINEFSDLSKKFHTSISKEQRQEEGIFFTPRKLRARMFECLGTELAPETILEPSFGSGEFLADAARLYPTAKITGIEKNAALFKGVTAEPTTQTLICGDFMEWQGKADLIIGNPPYFITTDKNTECMTGRPNIFVSFLYKCIKEHLNPGGTLAFILPTSLFNCNYYEPMRKYIAANTSIQHVEVFEKAGFYDTTQGTMLLILKKEVTENKDYLLCHGGNVYITPFYKELRELLKGTTTLAALGLKVKTGSIVWNQNKETLTDTPGDLVLYAQNIVDGEIVLGGLGGGKKQYIKDCKKEKVKAPVILVNRGYGNSYSLEYALVKGTDEFYAENHVNVIYGNVGKIPRVLKSLKDPRTAQFVQWFIGKGALSKSELENILPVF